MKTTITIAVLALLVWACHRKTIASDDIIISNKSKASTHTKTEEAAKAGEPVPDAPGKNIFINRCGRCHSLKNTEKYTSQEWENILKAMIPKAKLNDEEAKQLTTYIMEHSKK